jgi:hypothetical protein
MKTQFTAVCLLIAVQILTTPALAETTPGNVLGTWKTGVG